jgi:hypothetical protein
VRTERTRRKRWIDADGKVWLEHVMSERAYCLHLRDGIFGFFAYAWEDCAIPETSLKKLAPSDVVRVDNWPKGALPTTIKAGSFCRLLYISSKTSGTYRVEPIAKAKP